MKDSGMTFEKARGMLKGFLIAAVALCVVGLLVNSSSETAAFYCVMGAIICLAFGLFVLFTCVKCPYCGKRIIRNCLVVKNCPHCKRNLSSGLKGKSKKK